MMVEDKEAADRVRLMFEMYAQPQTSFGDITRYFSENGIDFDGKKLKWATLSNLLRNPSYAQADLELYEFFKYQGASIVNDAADFLEMNACYLYQGRNVPERKFSSLKDHILVLAPHEFNITFFILLQKRKKVLQIGAYYAKISRLCYAQYYTHP